MYKSGIHLTFIVAMVTKMTAKVGLKSRNSHFGPNLRLWGYLISAQLNTKKAI